MATNKGYATTSQLAATIGVKIDVPSREVGKNPCNETVGQGNSSDKIFYLDQKNILSGTYTLFYGANNSATTELTDVTDYVIELTEGKITLTDTGVTTLGTNSIYAKYFYSKNDMSNEFLEDTLNRAETKVDKRTNTTFTDGTATNPTYPSETEIQSSPGYFRNQIIADKKPLIDIVTTLDGAVTDSDTTISLASGTGANFPSSGQIIINSEVVSYTGVSTDDLTGCTRGQLGTTAASHDDGDAVHTTILFLSNTPEGTAVTYTAQPWNTQMHASDEGLFYSFDQSVFSDSQYPDRMTKQDVANRVKMIYRYGNNTIPDDITRLTLIFAKEMLVRDTIGASLIQGRDGFNPVVMDTGKSEAESIINSYIVLPMGNT